MDDRNRKIIIGAGGITALAGIIMLGRKAGAEPPPDEPPDEPIVYECPYCDMTFETEEELYEHINFEHPDLPPAEGAVIVYSNLRISPQSITVGDSTEIRVDANNIGDTAGTVEVYLGPDTGLSKVVTVDPGETRRVVWSYTPPNVGYYNLTIGPLEASLEVVEYEDPYQPPIDEDQTAMADHIPSGIVYTLGHTGPGEVTYDVPPDQANWIKHSGGYRYADNTNVIDFWLDSQGMHRYQIQGSHMAFPQHHIWEPGNMYWYSYQAQFNYMDDGCPNGWRSDWDNKWSLCVYSGSENWMCAYFPPKVN